MLLSVQTVMLRLAAVDEAERLSITPNPSFLRTPSGGGSIDLHLGRRFAHLVQDNVSSVRLYDGGNDRPSLRSAFFPFDSSLFLHPHDLMLGVTLEWIGMPQDLIGQISGVSSLSRRGLRVASATTIQPGFFGSMLLELSNDGTAPLELKPGMRIAQILFHELDIRDTSGEAAASPHAGQMMPTLGSNRDMILKRLEDAGNAEA